MPPVLVVLCIMEGRGDDSVMMEEGVVGVGVLSLINVLLKGDGKGDEEHLLLFRGKNGVSSLSPG